MLRFYLLLISFACAYGYVLVSLQQLNSTMAALKNDTFMLTHTEDFRDHSNYIKVSRGFEPELSFTKRNQMQSTVVPNRYIVKLKESLSDIQGKVRTFSAIDLYCQLKMKRYANNIG